MTPFDPKFTIQKLFRDGTPGEWFDYGDRTTHVELEGGLIAVLSKHKPVTEERKQEVRDGYRGAGVQVFRQELEQEQGK